MNFNEGPALGGCARLRGSEIWVTRIKTTKSIHVTGCSDLADLWVIRIKSLILCARSTSRSRDLSKKRGSRSENMREVYSIVKMKRFYDDQTWPTREIHEVRKDWWAYFSS